jgi:hypothetical protein
VVDGELLVRSVIGTLRDDLLNPDKLPLAGEAAPCDHDHFLPIATYAQIPRENTEAFLAQVDAWFMQYLLAIKLDGDRRQLKPAINAIKKATERLVYAFELLDKRPYGSFMLDQLFGSRFYHEWPELLECMAAFHSDKIGQRIAEDVLKTNVKVRAQSFRDHIDRAMEGETAQVAGLKYQLKTLIDAAQFLSTVRLPKRGEKLANRFIIGIFRIVETNGGDLHYDKNNHTGNVVGIYEFFHEMQHLHLSPSTLQRLLSSARRLKSAH